MGPQRFQLFALIALAAFPLLPPRALSSIPQEDPQEATAKQKLEEALTIVRDTKLRESDPERVIRAIEQLGQLHDPDAIGDLVELLTFRNWAPWEKDPNKAVDFSMPRSRGMIYPAVNALKEIGTASMPAIVKVIATNDPNSLETQNAMEVIIYLSRGKREKYVEDFKREAARAASPQAAQRLLKAAEVLEQSKR